MRRGTLSTVMVCCAAASALLPATPASAAAHTSLVPRSSSAVPFTDEYANGSITLCGRDNEPVTSGSLTTQPFVWKAVSSSPAPSGYGRAYLTLYQPLQYEDASDWTGYQMTDVAAFSPPAHPAAQSTNLDAPLLDPDRQLPPYWNGLYELRMYFASPLKAPFTTAYPTAVIRVSGNSWSLVRGGGVSCSAGQAVSLASRTASAAALATPQTIKVGSPTSGRPARGRSQGTSPTTASGTSSAAPGPTSAGPPAGRDATASKSASGPLDQSASGRSSIGLIAAITAGAVLAVGGAGTAFWRRRRRRNLT